MDYQLSEGAYRPGADGEGQWLCAAFAQAVGREFGDAGLSDAILARASELESDHASDAPSEPARSNLRYAVSVLAAHEILRHRFEPAEALIDRLAAAFAASGAVFTPKVRTWLDASPDAFADMVAMSKLREAESFGPRFELEHPRDDDSAYYADVRRCYWHDFFTRAGRPELTRVLCEFDRNWFSAIDPELHGLRFDRPTTLGTGGDRCRFHFSRSGLRSSGR
jgi:hypothetical protein